MIEIVKDTTTDGTSVYVQDYGKREHFRLAIFTLQTDDDAIDRFINHCKALKEKLLIVSGEYERCIKLNHDNPGKGKNYPIFSERENLINSLCKEAGIRDT